MKTYTKQACLALAVLASASCQAGIIDFIDLTENAGTGLGESAWSTLTTAVDGVTVSITASGHAKYAYLDWADSSGRHAGLGACGVAYTVGAHHGSKINQCNPDSDDNVTVRESLTFMFDKAVRVDNLWFNNNHDGGFDPSDMVNIAGTAYSVKTGYAGGINGIGSFYVAANTAFMVAYENEEFYIDGLEITERLPEPGSLALLGMGFLALGLMRRRYQEC